jgi:transposase
MPYRTYTRDQDWLFPPCLGELVPCDHPVRFVAEFVDRLDLGAAGIRAEAAMEGAPAYQPRLLLGAWVYGFMTRVRSSRKIEQACRETIPFMWLTGMQQPDHMTLWRFYKQNRQAMRGVLKLTIQLAVEAGLVGFVLQAVDGSRIAVSSGDSLRDRAGLEQQLAQVEAEIAAMEQANRREEAVVGQPPHGVHALGGKRAVRERVKRALEVVSAKQAKKTKRAQKAKTGRQKQTVQQPQALATDVTTGANQAATSLTGGLVGSLASTPRPTQAGERQGMVAGHAAQDAQSEAKLTRAGGPAQAGARKSRKKVGPLVSPTDPEAVLMKGRHGYLVGYNGQAVVDSQAQIVVAADVVATAGDVGQLLPMLQEARAMTGRQAGAAVADTAYFDITKIIAAQQAGREVFVPDPREGRADGPQRHPFHKSHFAYDAASDSYRCPQGQTLTFRCQHRWKSRLVRAYAAEDCRSCPFQQSGACTKARARALAIHGFEPQLEAHAAKMRTDAAKEILRQRSAIVEPVFALFREQLGLLRFLLRGLENVKGEWWLTCSAHNLRKLWKLWWRPKALGLAGT